MRRLGWVLALGLCSCAITRDSLGQLPAAGEAGKATAGAGAGGAGAAAESGKGGEAAGSSGAGGAGTSGSGGQAAGAPAAGAGGGPCSAGHCDGTGLSLDTYCKLEHARCPVDVAQARANACANTFAVVRQTYPNACGGDSVRMRYAFGSVEFYFDVAGKLSAVTTLTDNKGGACDATFYRYGDQRCAPAGKETDIPCN